MTSKITCLVLLATVVARTTCITNSEFFQQIKKVGDVEEIDTFPDKIDEDTIVLEGDPEDELDENFLAEALGLETNNAISERTGDVEGPDTLKGRRFDIFIFFRHKTVEAQRGGRTKQRCVSKNVIVNFGQPKKISMTFCLRTTQLSHSVYHVRLVQDEHVILDKNIIMMGSTKDICTSYRPMSENKKACMHFKLDGKSMCTIINVDFWANFTMEVDFKCQKRNQSHH